MEKICTLLGEQVAVNVQIVMSHSHSLKIWLARTPAKFYEVKFYK